jgi:hypothetical protein
MCVLDYIRKLTPFDRNISKAIIVLFLLFLSGPNSLTRWENSVGSTAIGYNSLFAIPLENEAIIEQVHSS